MRLEDREVLGETNQRRRKERTEKGGATMRPDGSWACAQEKCTLRTS